MIRHLAGIAEIVKDMDAAVGFYRDVLGLTVHHDQGAGSFHFLQARLLTPWFDRLTMSGVCPPLVLSPSKDCPRGEKWNTARWSPVCRELAG